MDSFKNKYLMYKLKYKNLINLIGGVNRTKKTQCESCKLSGIGFKHTNCPWERNTKNLDKWLNQSSTELRKSHTEAMEAAGKDPNEIKKNIPKTSKPKDNNSTTNKTAELHTEAEITLDHKKLHLKKLIEYASISVDNIDDMNDKQVEDLTKKIIETLIKDNISFKKLFIKNILEKQNAKYNSIQKTYIGKILEYEPAFVVLFMLPMDEHMNIENVYNAFKESLSEDFIPENLKFVFCINTTEKNKKQLSEKKEIIKDYDLVKKGLIKCLYLSFDNTHTDIIDDEEMLGGNFPYGSVRNRIMTSNTVKNYLINFITQEKHPYIYWQDFDDSSRLTKSSRHILDIVKYDILSQIRPIIIGGGFYATREKLHNKALEHIQSVINHKYPTDKDKFQKNGMTFIKKKGEGHNNELIKNCIKSDTKFNSEEEQRKVYATIDTYMKLIEENTNNNIDIFINLINIEMQFRNFFGKIHELMPYIPEPNLFIDGLHITHLKFDPMATEYNGIKKTFYDIQDKFQEKRKQLIKIDMVDLAIETDLFRKYFSFICNWVHDEEILKQVDNVTLSGSEIDGRAIVKNLLYKHNLTGVSWFSVFYKLISELKETDINSSNSVSISNSIIAKIVQDHSNILKMKSLKNYLINNEFKKHLKKYTFIEDDVKSNPSHIEKYAEKFVEKKLDELKNTDSHKGALAIFDFLSNQISDDGLTFDEYKEKVLNDFIEKRQEEISGDRDIAIKSLLYDDVFKSLEGDNIINGWENNKLANFVYEIINIIKPQESKNYTESLEGLVIFINNLFYDLYKFTKTTIPHPEDPNKEMILPSLGIGKKYSSELLKGGDNFLIDLFYNNKIYNHIIIDEI